MFLILFYSQFYTFIDLIFFTKMLTKKYMKFKINNFETKKKN